MKAAILIGGKAERLRPLTSGRSKAMVPVLAQPFLRIQLELLRAAGITHVVLCHGTRTQRMKAAFGDGSALGMELTWSPETRPLGTGGALGLARPHFTEPFVCLNGDVLADLDYPGLIRARQSTNATLTLAVTGVDDAAPYGAVRTGAGDEVTGFDEKSAAPGASGEVSVGAYAMTPEVFDRIPTGKRCSLETEVFPALVEADTPVTAFRHRGYFADIGTLPRYLQVHRDALAGRVHIPGAGKPNPGGMIVDSTATVHPSAQLLAPGLIGPGARVAEGARVGPGAVLGRRVRVEEGATVADSVLWADTRIGAGATVSESILAANTFVGPGARVLRAALGDKAAIPQDSVVPWEP